MNFSEAVRKMNICGVDSPEWDASLLFSHALKIRREEVLANPEKEYVSDVLEKLIERRCNREPLQYILGEWEFYRQTYFVSPDCLIPRPETELLVEKALQLLPKNACFADFCTGSGCIAISTLAERRDLTADAFDVSDKALAIAMKNAERNGVADRVHFEQQDLLHFQTDKKWDAILSNPPYIKEADLQGLSQEVKQEPILALDGGKKGLDFYCSFLDNFLTNISEGGFFLFEIGFDQGNDLLELGKKYALYTTIIKDYAGLDRMALMQKMK